MWLAVNYRGSRGATRLWNPVIFLGARSAGLGKAGSADQGMDMKSVSWACLAVLCVFMFFQPSLPSFDPSIRRPKRD